MYMPCTCNGPRTCYSGAVWTQCTYHLIPRSYHAPGTWYSRDCTRKCYSCALHMPRATHRRAMHVQCLCHLRTTRHAHATHIRYVWARHMPCATHLPCICYVCALHILRTTHVLRMCCVCATHIPPACTWYAHAVVYRAPTTRYSLLHMFRLYALHVSRATHVPHLVLLLLAITKHRLRITCTLGR